MPDRRRALPGFVVEGEPGLTPGKMREVKGWLGCLSSHSTGCKMQGSTSSIVLVLVLDSLDPLASAIPHCCFA